MTQTISQNNDQQAHKFISALAGQGVFGKIIWITGASSGIGKELASQLAALGAVLVLSSRREAVLNQVKSNLKNPQQHKVLVLDLADSASIEAVSKQAWSAFGHIDYLINNGGISQRSLCLDTQEAVDRQVMEVDYFGTIKITKAVTKKMIQRGSGQVICISSIAGKVGSNYRSAYSAAKHALIGFMDCLRAEITQYGIRILVVCPGWIHTNISRNALTGDMSLFAQMDQEIAKGMPVQEFVGRLIKAINSNQEEVVIATGLPLMAYHLRRFMPNRFHRIIRKIYKKQ